MKAKARQFGLTLTEMVVVVSIIAVFAVLGVPAIRAFIRSVESEGGARAMISASLASARAMAAQKQHYVGIRFQNKFQPDGKGCQYMIFIIHEEPSKMGGLANGFRAVEGTEPIKLPDSVGVMDLRLGSTNPDQIIDDDSKIDEDWEVTDTTTFSIIFSPSGKLVIHPVRVRNKDGAPDGTDTSKDNIFNTYFNVKHGITMFFQDDYAYLGFVEEPSRNSFIIYDRTAFEKLDPGSRYTNYLKDLDIIYINPYTGTMINK
jgi:prepilin-type N-terminal cleavage/methylation domain-containing protein